MPISSVGSRSRKRRAGVTLIELLIVMVLVSLLAGVSFPALTAGIDTLRMKQASDAVAAAFNQSLQRAERRQRPVEVVISRDENAVLIYGEGAAAERRIEMPDGVRIAGILPPAPFGDERARQFLLVPGGAAPRMGVVLENRRGTKRMVSVDPITGVPRVTQ